MKADFCIFVADLIAGDFDNLELGLVILGLVFSEVFDRLACGFFSGVTAPAFLLVESIAGERVREREFRRIFVS